MASWDDFEEPANRRGCLPGVPRRTDGKVGEVSEEEQQRVWEKMKAKDPLDKLKEKMLNWEDPGPASDPEMA